MVVQSLVNQWRLIKQAQELLKQAVGNIMKNIHQIRLRRTSKCDKGFTLIEVMVTVVVLVIVVTIGVPNFVNLLERNRVVATANDLLGSLQLARSEAVRLNTTAQVCSSSNGQSCSGGWADGWIVIRDNVVIRVSSAVPPQVSISGPASIVFESAGNVELSNLSDELSFEVSSNGFERCVNLIVSGRAEVEVCP